MSRLLYGEGPPLTDPLLVGGTLLVCGATMVYSMGIEALYDKFIGVSDSELLKGPVATELKSMIVGTGEDDIEKKAQGGTL